MSPERIGIFGGSFNPIHTGHLIVSEEILNSLQLDSVLFVPSAIPPHKGTTDLAPFADRFRMIELAIEDNPRFQVDDIELRLSGKSFTVRTLRQFKKSNPDWEIYFLLGLDSLLEIKTWKEPDSIFDLCQMIVFDRPGYNREDVEAEIASRVFFSEATRIGISASMIREKLQKGGSIRYLVPESVERYIRSSGLYV